MARSHFSSGSSRSHSSSRSSFSSSRSHSYNRSSSSARSHLSSYSRNTSHRPIFATSHRHTSIHLHGDSSTGSGRANIKSGLSIVIIFLIIVGLAISLSTFGSISTAKDELVEIENSYNYFQNMISYAESHPEYKATGVITYIGPDSNSDKYYIEYTIYGYNSYNQKYIILQEESFAMYTTNDYYNLSVGQTIDIALNYHNPKYATDSINMDYKNISLEEDVEYQQKLSQINSSKMFAIITPIIMCVVITFIIVGMISAKKRVNTSDTQSDPLLSTSNIDSNDTNQTKEVMQEPKYCEYCGTHIPNDQTKCPSCGASNKR